MLKILGRKDQVNNWNDMARLNLSLDDAVTSVSLAYNPVQPQLRLLQVPPFLHDNLGVPSWV